MEKTGISLFKAQAEIEGLARLPDNTG